MTTRGHIEVTADQLEQFAFEKGAEIILHADHASLRIGSRTFVAELPAQRQPGSES